MSTASPVPPAAVPAGEAARQVMEEADRVMRIAAAIRDAPERARRDARSVYEGIRETVVAAQMQRMPVERLRETTEGRLRLGPVQDAGIGTVAQVLATGMAGLARYPGIGPSSAANIIAAAQQIEGALRASVRVRIDADTRPSRHADLIAALAAVREADSHVAAVRANLQSIVDQVATNAPRASRARSRLRMFFTGPDRRRDAESALANLAVVVAQGRDLGLPSTLAALSLPPLPARELWADYERRAAEYNSLLIDVVGQPPETATSQGFLPNEVADRIAQHGLDVDLLRVTLRGYQAFGAKFALSQRRAILGDEMGLGKTIEALAVACHLASEGATHFLVVCPANVLVNWIHEVERHTQLTSIRLHGEGRDRNAGLWRRRGGVGVTTFETLRSLAPPEDIAPALLVVDEAHYIKNPDARRTQAVRGWIDRTERVLLLSGTPMENRVEDFKTLVGHLSPQVAASIRSADGLGGSRSFRMAAASIYLRRNQEDVLTELPPRIEIEEWVELTAADQREYRDAVASGNFMAMRRAAYVASDSAKMSRLTELIDEASADGRKVVVFSYFLDVLARVSSALGARVTGQLTGAVPPAHRQALIDRFTNQRAPAVLLAQVEAGGIGVNIQTASVVILCEPQWKPSTEEQAIARSHRMGQARTVNVHRMLADNTVDLHMRRILTQKGLLFDEYVRRSDLKDSTPAAVDVSSVAAVAEAASQAEDERRIIELERGRLGLPQVAAT